MGSIPELQVPSQRKNFTGFGKFISKTKQLKNFSVLLLSFLIFIKLFFVFFVTDSFLSAFAYYTVYKDCKS